MAIPMRRADEPLAATHRERRAQVGADPVGDPAGVVGVDDRVEDDPELVAAEARDGVARSERADQPLTDGDQQAVADGVPDALVDDLEPVQVEEHDRDRRGGPGVGRRQGVTDPVGQQLAVREAGDRVVQRAAPSGVEQARIVEGDRRELGEANEGVRLARAERSDRAFRTRGR